MSKNKDSSSALLSIGHNDKNILCSIFIIDAIDSLNEMQLNIAHKDLKGIVNNVNVIKERSKTLNLVDIHNLAKKIELSLREGKDVDYHKYYTQLSALINTL